MYKREHTYTTGTILEYHRCSSHRRVINTRLAIYGTISQIDAPSCPTGNIPGHVRGDVTIRGIKNAVALGCYRRLRLRSAVVVASMVAIVAMCRAGQGAGAGSDRQGRELGRSFQG